jgi:hypothetical protein
VNYFKVKNGQAVNNSNAKPSTLGAPAGSSTPTMSLSQNSTYSTASNMDASDLDTIHSTASAAGEEFDGLNDEELQMLADS